MSKDPRKDSREYATLYIHVLNNEGGNEESLVSLSFADMPVFSSLKKERMIKLN
jgi:hypothetical protein